MLVHLREILLLMLRVVSFMLAKQLLVPSLHMQYNFTGSSRKTISTAKETKLLPLPNFSSNISRCLNTKPKDGKRVKKSTISLLFRTQTIFFGTQLQMLTWMESKEQFFWELMLMDSSSSMMKEQQFFIGQLDTHAGISFSFPIHSKELETLRFLDFS